MPDISMPVKQRVREIALRLNYQVNDLARGLVTNKTRTVGLIVPDVANPFYSAISKQLIELFERDGYRLLICNSGRSWQKEKGYLDFLMRQRVDGFVIIPSNVKNAEFRDFLSLRLPVVLVDAPGEEFGVDSVTVDDYKGATDAVRHLIDLGYRRIAHITQHADSTPSRERLRGYRDVLAKYNLPLADELTVVTDSTFEGGVEGARRLMSGTVRPDAIFAVNDFVAMGVYQWLHAEGIAVPIDIALVGYDDVFLARMMPVPLTTVHQSTTQLAREASRLLLNRLNNPVEGECENILLEPKLIVRASCGARSKGAGHG
jgi:LacI family transcriptional regulator